MHNATNNPFWSYSLTQYSNPDCETFCLDAQNTHGLDVNLILFSVWLATQNRMLNLDLLPSFIKQHQQGIVTPLRDLRIKMKARARSNEQISNLRDSLKRLELQAEQLEQWWLFQHSTTLSESDSQIDCLAIAKANLKKVYDLGMGSNEGEEDWIEAAIHHLYPG